MPKPIIHDNFVLFSCSPFANAETTVSSRENADVNVANVNSARNTVKKNPPNGIWLNTDGNTINSNPGPSVGSIPNENTAGKIARPANNETNKFNPTIVIADFGKLSFYLNRNYT